MIYRSSILSKYFCLLILIVSCVSCISRTQEKDDVSGGELTNITFKQSEYDFGKIPAEKSVSTVFEFSNTGESPLLIKGVTTSCGCTVPKWSKEMIAPNEAGKIIIVYDAKYPGRFDKKITVVYNGKDSPLELTIKGEVPYPTKK
jgi:hypothetical protein